MDRFITTGNIRKLSKLKQESKYNNIYSKYPGMGLIEGDSEVLYALINAIMEIVRNSIIKPEVLEYILDSNTTKQQIVNKYKITTLGAFNARLNRTNEDLRDILGFSETIKSLLSIMEGNKVIDTADFKDTMIRVSTILDDDSLSKVTSGIQDPMDYTTYLAGNEENKDYTYSPDAVNEFIKLEPTLKSTLLDKLVSLSQHTVNNKISNLTDAEITVANYLINYAGDNEQLGRFSEVFKKEIGYDSNK